MTAQRDPLDGGALLRGRPAGRPQGRQEQGRLAQVRPAAPLPIGTVGTGRHHPQGGHEGIPVSRTVGRVLGHPGGDQRPQRVRYRLQRYRLRKMLVKQCFDGVPAERRLAGQAFETGGRGRVDVGGRGGRGARELLRGRVVHGARGHRMITRPGRDAEVGELAGSVPVDQHVFRLVVPVHHPALVRRGQAQQRALQHHQGRLGRGGALVLQDLAQRDAVDEFHDDRGAVGRLHVLVQPDQVRILQRAQHGRLGAEHLHELGISQQVPAQVLDGDRRARSVVPGQHDLAEPARAQRLQPGVPGDFPFGHAGLPPSTASARLARPRSGPS